MRACISRRYDAHTHALRAFQEHDSGSLQVGPRVLEGPAGRSSAPYFIEASSAPAVPGCGTGPPSRDTTLNALVVDPRSDMQHVRDFRSAGSCLLASMHARDLPEGGGGGEVGTRQCRFVGRLPVSISLYAHLLLSTLHGSWNDNPCRLSASPPQADKLLQYA